VSQEWTGRDKRALRRERFELEAGMVHAERDADLAAIRRNTAVAWLACYYGAKMSAAATRFVEASRAEVEAADAAYRAGRGAQSDVISTRSALALAEDRRIDIERRLRGARLELVRWTGSSDTASLAAAPDMSTVHLEHGSLEAHLDRHPEIVALGRRADVAQAEARIAATARHPDWTWEASYQQRGPAYSNHDFAVFKNFPMGGTRKFQFRASFTNVFNHPQRFFDDNTNLRLSYTNGQLSNQQFGVLPRDNKYGRRIVQLARAHLLLNQMLDGAAHRLRCWVTQHSHRCFGRIGQHGHRRLSGLGTRSRIAEVCWIHPAVRIVASRPAQEVGDVCRSMVFRNKRLDHLRQCGRFSQGQPVEYVTPNQSGRLQRSHLIVGIRRGSLVFHEMPGARQLADVVIVASDPREKPVGTDDVASGLAEARHRQAVGPGARGLEGQTPEQRPAEI